MSSSHESKEGKPRGFGPNSLILNTKTLKSFSRGGGGDDCEKESQKGVNLVHIVKHVRFQMEKYLEKLLKL